MAFLELRDVHKTFGTNPVLRGIDLDVDLHQVVCLIGASGSGKSTLLRCINQLETVDSGTIHLGGDRVSGRGIDVDALRREVGIVFQSFNLFPHMTVLQNVTLAPVKVLGLTTHLAEERGDRTAGQLEVLPGHGLHEIFYQRADHQIDRRPPKSVPGQARPQAGGMGAGQIHQQIEFRTTVVKEIARAVVALEKILAELLEVVLAQRPFPEDHPGVLAQYVVGAFVFALGQRGPVRLEVREFDQAKGAGAKLASRRGAEFAQFMVRADGGRRWHAGIANHHGDFANDRQRFHRVLEKVLLQHVKSPAKE